MADQQGGRDDGGRRSSRSRSRNRRNAEVAALRREVMQLRAELRRLRQDTWLLGRMSRLAAQLHFAHRGLAEAAERLYFASCALTDPPSDEE